MINNRVFLFDSMICFGIKISLSKFKCCNISISPTFMIRQSLKHKENRHPKEIFHVLVFEANVDQYSTVHLLSKYLQPILCAGNLLQQYRLGTGEYGNHYVKRKLHQSYQLSTKYFGTYLSDQCYVYLVQEMESYGWGPWALSDFIRINYNCANYM